MQIDEFSNQVAAIYIYNKSRTDVRTRMQLIMILVGAIWNVTKHFIIIPKKIEHIFHYVEKLILFHSFTTIIPVEGNAKYIASIFCFG